MKRSFTKFNTYAAPTIHPANRPAKRVKVEGPAGGLLSTQRQRMVRSIRRRVNMRRRRGGRRRGLIRKRLPRPLAPSTKIIKCSAVTYRNMGTADGVLYKTSVQLNSCDDPFTDQGTGQPLGYDQWKALYRKAIIVGSRITVKFHNAGTGSVMVGIHKAPINQTTSSLSNYEYYMEVPGTIARLLSPDVDHIQLSMGASTKRHLHLKDLRDNNEIQINLETETAPSKIAYYHVFAQPTAQAAVTMSVEAVIKVTYIVLLIDPVIPARSVES